LKAFRDGCLFQDLSINITLERFQAGETAPLMSMSKISSSYPQVLRNWRTLLITLLRPVLNKEFKGTVCLFSSKAPIALLESPLLPKNIAKMNILNPNVD